VIYFIILMLPISQSVTCGYWERSYLIPPLSNTSLRFVVAMVIIASICLYSCVNKTY